MTQASISARGGFVTPRFPYDEELKNRVKALPGARFTKDGYDPRRTVPISLLPIALRLFPQARKDDSLTQVLATMDNLLKSKAVSENR